MHSKSGKDKYINMFMMFMYLLIYFIFLGKMEIGEHPRINLENENIVESTRLFVGGMLSLGFICYLLTFRVSRINKVKNIILLSIQIISLGFALCEMRKLYHKLARVEELEAVQRIGISEIVVGLIMLIDCICFVLLLKAILKGIYKKRLVENNEETKEIIDESAMGNSSAGQYKPSGISKSTVKMCRVILYLVTVVITFLCVFGIFGFPSSSWLYHLGGGWIYALPMPFVFEIIIKKWMSERKWGRSILSLVLMAYFVYATIEYVMPTVVNVFIDMVF